MHPDRWEVGSHHHWPGVPPPGDSPLVPWSAGRLLSSGRDALRMALALGSQAHGWRRLWVPDYFCQHVVASLLLSGLELHTYPDDPRRRSPEPPDARRGDVILAINYFGLRDGPGMPRPENVGLIEDHSHDPTSAWAFESGADFCVASLRKTVPLPDGGVVWSPVGHGLPPAPRQTAQRRRTAATRLQAMILKAMYLGGHPLEKADYLAMADRAEQELHRPDLCAMSAASRVVLASFPIDAWRRARVENHSILLDAIAGLDWIGALGPAAPGGAPFSVALVLDSAERRDRVRARLLERRIYPAVLWPLDAPLVPVGEAARDLASRFLSIPCDARYSGADMARVGEILRAAAHD
jgi:hypothetical protein